MNGEENCAEFFNLDICVVSSGPTKKCLSTVQRTWVCGRKPELYKGKDSQSPCTAPSELEISHQGLAYAINSTYSTLNR